MIHTTYDHSTETLTITIPRETALALINKADRDAEDNYFCFASALRYLLETHLG